MNFLTKNIIPDRYRIFPSNKPGLYQHPVAIFEVRVGEILSLNWNDDKHLSVLVQLRLHSPAETVILQDIETAGVSMCSVNGVVMFCGK